MGSSRIIRLLCVAGTRPEAIKFAPILLAAAERPDLDCRLCATGQHGELFDEPLIDFGLSVDTRISTVLHDPSPDVMTERFANAIEPLLIGERPDMVLVLRDVTERPEGIATGNLRLVGTDADRIVAEASRLLDDPAAHAAMARPNFPFGRGDASVKILDAIQQYFSSAPLGDHPLPFARARIMDGAR